MPSGFGGAKFHSKRMDACGQFLCEAFVNRSLAFETGQTLKRRCDHANPKVRLAPFAPAPMAPVLLAFVDHLERLRREFSGQL